MKKRGQINNVVLYTIIVIAAVLILYFGFTQITKFLSLSKQGELITFTKTLETSLKDQRAGIGQRAGSVKQETFFLPNDINSVCFIDETKGYNLFVNPELNELIEIYPNNNLYFKPKKFIPTKIEYLELNEKNNPLCVKVINGQIKLKLTSKKEKTEINAAELYKEEMICNLISGISNPENKVDIVFLGYAYDKEKEFKEDVNNYINNVFLDIEPLKSNKDKFTFYSIDKFEDLDCSFRNWIECDDYKVKKLASNCPNDYIIVLAARGKIQDFFNPIRSSAIGNVERVNTADNPNVVMHEFGHLFADLADEYVDNDYYGSFNFDEEHYPNCDSAGCVEWENITDSSVGCFGGGQKGAKDGCSLTEYFRPTKTSIMKELNVNDFGLVNENIIQEKLDDYGGPE